jgi:hypothetical protein
VKFARQKAVINGFAASDFATRVRIDIRVYWFLIDNLIVVKLVVQLAINEWQHRNQISKKQVDWHENRKEK